MPLPSDGVAGVAGVAAGRAGGVLLLLLLLLLLPPSVASACSFSAGRHWVSFSWREGGSQSVADELKRKASWVSPPRVFIYLGPS